MSSYRQILKSSALFGGTQVLTILVGIVRTKFLAVLLGPAGVGVAGMYQSTTGLIGTVAGFGVGRAGVRQIAEAVGSGDDDKIALTCRTVRWLSLGSGIFGMLAVLLFSKPLSFATFGSGGYVWGVATVSLVLLFNGISAGQTALLQGMRRLKDLAVCQVAGTIFGSVASVAIIYLFGAAAVAWYLVAIAAFGILTSWWYARRVRLAPCGAPRRLVAAEAGGLLRMGVAFMVSGLVNAGTLYLARVLVIRELGIETVGLYTAVITLSSIYVNTVLQAMAADYYPRLTAVANDHPTVNRMVNEQTEMGLLLAIPGILATLTLAPWVLQLFYTRAFTAAAPVIQWQLMGIALCVISWPIGIIIPAKGLSRLLIFSELATAAIQCALLLVGMKLWGFEGVGISYLFTYLAHVVIVFVIARKATGFSWSPRALTITLIGTVLMVAVFAAVRLLPSFPATVTGLALTLVASAGCFFAMKKMLGGSILKIRKGAA